MAFISLKTKMSVAVSLLVIALVGALALSLFSYFENQTKKSIAQHQAVLISGIADDIDDKILRSLNALISVAKTISPDIINDPEKAQIFLDKRPGTHSIFDNGLFLFSADGKIIAESPYRPGRRGRDISFRDYYKKTVATQRPQISDPYLSTHNPGKPAIILTVPVFDSSGRLQAIFAGSLDLTKQNFLGKLSHIRLGRTGYLFLFTTDGTFVMHPDPGRILRPGTLIGSSFFHMAANGFEGTKERENSRGIRVLTTYRHLRATNWILGANYPLKEAYAPVEQAKFYVALASFFGIILSILVVWLGMRYLTMPLLNMARHIRSMHGEPGKTSPVEVLSEDEIGELGLAFNDLLDRVGKEQEALREAVLTAKNERAKSEAIVAALGDGMSMVDTDFKVLYQNKVHQTLAGGEFIGSYCYQAFEGKDAPCSGCPVAMSFADGLVHTAERVVERDGEKLYLEITASPLFDYDGRINAGIEVVRNISRRKQMESAIEQMAFHDALTGLPNRRLFNERLAQAIAYAQRNDQFLAVMFLDLDHFKDINDSLGHTIGDELLKEVATRLKRCGRRAEDTIARQGGDEFLLFLSEIKDKEDAVHLAALLLQEMTAPFILSGYELFVSVSIGISIYPHDGRDVETLASNADIAMYRAKQQGRNSVNLYNHSMGEKNRQRLTVETSLRRAIGKNQLVLHYQPQVSVHSGKIIGMEALVRWNHPEQGLLLPTSFIPQAEETGLILDLGEWVLETAAAQNKAWQDAGYPPVKISVNYSQRQLRQQDFVEKLLKSLKQTGLEARWLELEIREAVMAEGIMDNLQALAALRDVGVRIAIDNFGAGYSCLKQLGDFPLDALKIDLSFVSQISSSEVKKAIAGTVASLAKGLHLSVIAQGVETKEQMQLLCSLGYGEMQGNYFSNPLPAEEAGLLLSRENDWSGPLWQLSQK
ncbi:sensor diguanylate cyclase/phosphodiesterase, Cache_1, HAMP and PAS domain-containing [Geotalea daltonii FRC-32]|uniref:Sensor diguanylate cyclase/phosphodiesterase, Cache_1, HAMP and PAS domain-containing n=1 Tax=Geotalea daltonii (strain DSM 22248 / JCM 15807 / FRC-32) TaxID=316067 RepID=B9M3D1_GEODF|nr:EAL domain-containing protein [Geotalea daltonii]ACM19541.1 sensor diguanylate cyclase/phosphodiesterase, Cache_1, HAMP and PAS domain-containing [Geotalea daltonii FRC-32]